MSDLLFVSDLLKNVDKEKRNYYLREIILEINKNLPSNVYVPIKASTIYAFNDCLKDGVKKIKNR